MPATTFFATLAALSAFVMRLVEGFFVGKSLDVVFKLAFRSELLHAALAVVRAVARADEISCLRLCIFQSEVVIGRRLDHSPSRPLL